MTEHKPKSPRLMDRLQGVPAEPIGYVEVHPEMIDAFDTFLEGQLDEVPSFQKKSDALNEAAAESGATTILKNPPDRREQVVPTQSEMDLFEAALQLLKTWAEEEESL